MTFCLENGDELAGCPVGRARSEIFSPFILILYMETFQTNCKPFLLPFYSYNTYSNEVGYGSPYGYSSSVTPQQNMGYDISADYVDSTTTYEPRSTIIDPDFIGGHSECFFDSKFSVSRFYVGDCVNRFTKWSSSRGLWLIIKSLKCVQWFRKNSSFRPIRIIQN